MVIDKIINQYLKLDPTSEQRLVKLAGKLIAINVGYFDYTLYLLLQSEGVALLKDSAQQPDVTLRGTPLDFLRYSLSNKFTGDIAVSGDMEVAQQFKELFAQLDIDWEEQLSKVTGDVVAHQIGKFFRALCEWCKRSADTLRQDVSEYVQEEAQLFPPRAELQDFFADVDKLRDDVERIELRIKKLNS
jgi:ubiquinone biosynthesis accessory factor UbiJ